MNNLGKQSTHARSCVRRTSQSLDLWELQSPIYQLPCVRRQIITNHSSLTMLEVGNSPSDKMCEEPYFSQLGQDGSYRKLALERTRCVVGRLGHFIPLDIWYEYR